MATDTPSSQTTLTDEQQIQFASHAEERNATRKAISCPYVIGVGASAGGLQPLEEFFANMPRGTGAAFIVVQHLSPDFKSVMNELLARRTKLDVVQAENGMLIEPEHVYLLPPKKNMTIDAGRLRLTDQDLSSRHRLNFPIDGLFESLAWNLGDKAIGVVLSGTGTDGTRGVREINEEGGFIFVQDPETAQFDGMPRSAIATGLTHYSLPPDELAQVIRSIISRVDSERDDTFSQHPELHNDDVMSEITAILRTEGDLDFSHYKTSTLARRTSRRMMIAGIDEVSDYLQLLNESETERNALRNDLLISVTHFFRDPTTWQFLENEIIPPIIEKIGPDESIRVWVTACATGEEAYSIAMLLHEGLQRAGKDVDVKIFATDIDKEALERASSGLFTKNIADEVGEERLNKYFIPAGDYYRISRAIRKMVIFAHHNLTRDAPFTKMDLVTCRNVLIYMQPHLQSRVLRMLHFALKHQSTLLLGAAETVGDLETEFDTLSSKLKVYQKARDIMLNPSHSHGRVASGDSSIIERRLETPSTRRRQQVEAVVTEALRFHFAQGDSMCLLVATSHELLHAFGKTELFMHIPEGESTSDVTKLVAKELSLPLSTALRRAQKEDREVAYQGIQFKAAGQTKSVNISVRYHAAGNRTPEFLLVIMTLAEAHRETATETYDSDSQAAMRIADLEQELLHSRENLQATIEELETTNEEQQATNEELLASNEELQSTNEELHSVNEELHTVNSEYQAKIQELSELNADMDNLLRSTNIGTIFLDEEMRIRKFTPAVTDIINIVEHDIGRPIDHFSYGFDVPDFSNYLREVLVSGEPIERDIITKDGRYLILRILPYRTELGTSSGVVLTFVDITDRQTVEAQLRDSERRYRAASDGSFDAFYLLDAVRNKDHKIIDFEFKEVNEAGATLLSRRREEVIGENLCDLLPTYRERGFLDKYVRVVEQHKPLRESFRVDDPEIQAEWLHHQVIPVADGIAITTRDITAAKRNEREIVRYQRICHDSPAILWEMDAKAEMTWVNRQWLEFTGRGVEQELGQGWLEGISVEDRQKLELAVREAINKQQKLQIEFQLTTIEDRSESVRMFGEPIITSTGVTGLVGQLLVPSQVDC